MNSRKLPKIRLILELLVTGRAYLCPIFQFWGKIAYSRNIHHCAVLNDQNRKCRTMVSSSCQNFLLYENEECIGGPVEPLCRHTQINRHQHTDINTHTHTHRETHIDTPKLSQRDTHRHKHKHRDTSTHTHTGKSEIAWELEKVVL